MLSDGARHGQLPEGCGALVESSKGRLPQREECYRTLFENATVGIYRATPEGRLLAANPALIKMLGYESYEELCARDFDQQAFESPDLRCRFREEVSREGFVKGWESAWLRRDGFKVFTRESATAIRGEDGRVVYYDGIVEDVTESKRAEEALRRSERRYREFISCSREGVWRIELETPIPLGLSEEERVERLLGCSYVEECDITLARSLGFSSTQEVLGKRLSHLLSSADTELLESFRSAARGGFQNRTIEFRVLDKAWNLRHFVRTEIPIIENGRLTRIWGITRDVTERKRAGEALRQSEERFRATFENAGIGMAIVDLDGHPIKCNSVLQKMLGYNSEELGRMVFTDFTHPDDRQLDWGLYSELVQGKRDRYEIEKRYIRKDGHMLWGLLIVSLVRDAHGAPEYGIGMLEDITERKRAETELCQTQAELAAA